jgi:hypothetical protein
MRAAIKKKFDAKLSEYRLKLFLCLRKKIKNNNNKLCVFVIERHPEIKTEMGLDRIYPRVRIQFITMNAAEQVAKILEQLGGPTILDRISYPRILKWWPDEALQSEQWLRDKIAEKDDLIDYVMRIEYFENEGENPATMFGTNETVQVPSTSSEAGPSAAQAESSPSRNPLEDMMDVIKKLDFGKFNIHFSLS